MDADEFDYVIVGGGSAGCLLANRLSADPAKRVCLLEAGTDDRWIWIDIPVGYLYCIANPRTDWMYRTAAEPGLNGRDIHYARGRGLGGCSLINAMIYMRGQKRDYDEWAALTGDDGWSWDKVLPVFKQHEDSHRGAGHFHGAGGELRVEEQRLSWKILDRFARAAEQAGIPRTEDFNTGNNAGSGRFEVTQRTGVRWHAGKAFLRPVRKRPNLVVRDYSTAQRLVFDGRRCIGVEVRNGRHDGPATWLARARGEVILAAGAVGSPQLLQLSGVGAPGLLAAHQIPVVHALDGVGANLQDHLQLRMAFKVRGIRTLNTMANSLWGKAWMGLEYAFRRRGPLTMAPSQLGVFWHSSPEHATPNIEYHVQPLSLDKFGDPLHRFPAFTASVCNLRPTSRGHVRIVSADPGAKPEIRCNYLSTAEDRKVAADALRLTRRIVSMPALQPYAPEEFLPGAALTSDDDLARAAGDIGTTIFHPVGTCRMGRSAEAGAVVDAQLRVFGLEGLRVADASVMPTITSGNTNAPTTMIAERAAAIVRATPRAAPSA
ncbi:MAG: GMC family oxidoreductase N-terminal domain-containing protein [Burkholderiales bacterium]|nr:GMC family oxidoreductase N-terminal domain-containing protein [Burkholderiales bacterium]